MPTDGMPLHGLTLETLLSPGDGLALGLDRELIWSWNQIVLQHRYAGTPPGFCNHQERQQAISRWEEQYRTYRQTHDHFFCPKAILPPEQFVGREEELQDIHRHLTGAGSSGKVLLHGMGGIGKTTLARAYAIRFAGEYDTILWMHFRSDLTHTVCDDGELTIQNLSWSSGQYANQSQYFSVKWAVFQTLLQEQRILLILDDMNQLQDRRFPLLWQLPCHMLITSRVCRADWPVTVIPVAPLKTEDAWHSFYSCYSSTPPDAHQTQQLDAFRSAVQGNTLLMQLAVCNPGYRPAVQELGEDMAQYFLRGNLLGGREREALRVLSLLPVSGLEVSIFLRAAGLNRSTLDKLQAMSLVWIREWKGSLWCGLHPVIAEGVRVCYPPTQENCRKFLRGMEAEYTNIWHAPYTEVTKAIPICFALLDAWAVPRPWLADSFDAFATVLWIGGYFEESLQYMLRLYHSCEDYYGTVHQVTGSIALRVGAVYHNSMQFAQAKVWYQRALEILRASKPHNVLYYYRLAQAAHKLCRDARHKGLYAEAEKYCQESMEALKRYESTVEQMPPQHRGSCYFLKLEQAKILFGQKEYEQTQQMCRLLREQFCAEKDAKLQYFLTELDLLRAEALLRLGHIAEARRLAAACVDTARRMRGETAKETLGCQEVLADTWAASGESETARQLYQEILCKLARNYPSQTAWYQTILEKDAAL